MKCGLICEPHGILNKKEPKPAASVPFVIFV